MGVVVERMVPHDFALESACGSISGGHGSVRKLWAEGCGYIVFVSVCMRGQGDELVGGGFGFLSGQCSHCTLQPSGVLVVGETV